MTTTLYRLNMTALVEAESESAARQCYIDGDWLGISLVSVDDLGEVEP